MASQLQLDYGRSFSLTEAPECTICSERYDDVDDDLIPRNLACGHSLCSRCIVRCMAMSGQQVERGISMTCPSKCTQQTIVEEGNVTSLPKNFAVLEIVHSTRERSASLTTTMRARSPSMNSRNALQMQLGDGSEYASNCDVCETSDAIVVCPSCAVCLCQSCSDDIHSRKGYHVHQLVPFGEFMSSLDNMFSDSLRQRSSSDSDLLEEPKHCKSHSSELVEYLCEVCYEEVCRLCHVSGEHRDHDCRLLTDIAIEKREVLRRMVDEVNQCHAEWNKGFDHCHEMREHLYHRQRGIEAGIKSHFHSIHSALHAKEEYLLAVVRSEIESRSKQLNSQADQLAKVCVVAKDLVEDCEGLLGDSTSEVVRHADHLLAQAQQYMRSEQDTNPATNDCIEANFSHEEELLQLVKGLGQLYTAPGRVLDLHVKATGPSELTLSWKPPQGSPTCKAAHTFIAECSSGNGPYRVISESQSLECVVEGCATGEDMIHRFRVAAVNDVGMGPYSLPVTFTQRKAAFLWDANLKHTRARISNNGYTVSIGENALWVSVGTNTVLSHGQHYWEVVLDRYGSPSMSRKVVIGVVSSSYHHWHKSHGVIGIKTCPIGNRSWGLACGTAKKLSSGSTFLNALGRKHNLFKEGDAVGVLLDLQKHKMAFYRNGEPLGLQFNDVYGPVIPAISFCRNKVLTLRFPPLPEYVSRKTSFSATVMTTPPSPNEKRKCSESV